MTKKIEEAKIEKKLKKETEYPVVDQPITNSDMVEAGFTSYKEEK